MVVEPTRAWPNAHRARALELAFEGCSVPAAYVGRGSAMAAFASARTTACVVDVGHQGATAVPVSDGYALQKATQIGRVGGHHLSQRLYEKVENILRQRSESKIGRKDQVDGDVEMKDESQTSDSRLRAVHEIRRATRTTQDADSHSQTETNVNDPHQVRAPE